MAMALITGEQMTADRVEAESWTWQTGISVAEQVHDNVFLQPGGPPPQTPTDLDQREKTDFITTLGATLIARRESDRLTIDLSYDPEFNFYAKFNDLNSVSHRGVALLQAVGLGPGPLRQAQLDVSDAYIRSTEDQHAREASTLPPGPLNINTTRTETTRNTAAATLLVPFTDTVSASLGYSHSFSEYEDPTLIDSIEQTISAGADKVLSARTTIAAIYSLHLFDFEGDHDISQSVLMELATSHSPTLSTAIAAGASYHRDTQENILIGSASVTKQFRYTKASASYSRDMSSSTGGVFNEPTTTETFAASLTRAMGERAEALLAGDWTDVRSESTGAALRSFSVDAGVSYQATRWLAVRTAYRHFSQQGNATDFVTGTDPEYRTDSITITLAGTWGDLEP